MAPAGNRFDKTSPKEHFGGGCCSHREWAKVRNPGMRLSTNAVVGLELKATGSRILGLNPAFPHELGPRSPILQRKRDRELSCFFPCWEKAGKFSARRNNLPQDKLPPGSPAA